MKRDAPPGTATSVVKAYAAATLSVFVTLLRRVLLPTDGTARKDRQRFVFSRQNRETGRRRGTHSRSKPLDRNHCAVSKQVRSADPVARPSAARTSSQHRIPRPSRRSLHSVLPATLRGTARVWLSGDPSGTPSPAEGLSVSLGDSRVASAHTLFFCVRAISASDGAR